MTVLVLEGSTSAAKAMVIDVEEHNTNIVVKPYPSPVRNNAAEILTLVLQAGKEALAGRQSVDIVSLGSAWHGLLLCDDALNPASVLWTWAETFASDICETLRKDQGYVAYYYAETGCMVHSMYPYFKLKYLQQTGDLKNRCKIADLGSFMFWSLTGSWVTTPSLASGSGLLNLSTYAFSTDLLNDLNLSRTEQFPTLKGLGYAAQLNSDAAKFLGIKAGIPVLPCYPDGGLNQVGSDALAEGIMTLSMGTSGAMRLSVSQPTFSPSQSTWCYISPKGYLAGAATSGCCNCVDWVKDSFFHPSTTYKEIEDPIRSSNDVPTFLPFLFGERCPGWDDSRTAAFLNLRASHDATAQYQAVLEGVIFNLYQCFLELKMHTDPISAIKLSGGVLNSKAWSQMCADIFGLEMTIDATAQSSLLGGARLAIEHLGMTPPPDIFQKNGIIIKPREGDHISYQDKFNEYLYWYNETARNWNLSGHSET